jgi:hypothetical protein
MAMADMENSILGEEVFMLAVVALAKVAVATAIPRNPSLLRDV